MHTLKNLQNFSEVTKWLSQLFGLSISIKYPLQYVIFGVNRQELLQKVAIEVTEGRLFQVASPFVVFWCPKSV